MGNIYESTTLLDQYLLFHFGADVDLHPWPQSPEGVGRFPERTVSALLSDAPKGGRALDVGCAVGGSSFELSQDYDEVIGIDFSQSFIDAAQKIASGEEVPYDLHQEAHVSEKRVARLPQTGNAARVSFEVGDATALRADLGAFQVVHAANLICRLPDPVAFLNRASDLVAPGGWLGLATPCTWLGEFTPPDNWPEGETIDWLKQHLEGEFELVKQVEIPMLIRETRRKYQWTVSLGTSWQRRG